MVAEKLPPHDIAAEEAVIGSLLVDSDAIYRVASLLRPQDFFRERNRWAYEACLALFDRSEAVNPVGVAHELARGDRLEELGGAAYLSQIIAGTPTSVHAEHYARLVHRLAIFRRLIQAGGQIAALGFEGGPDVSAALNQAEDVLYRLREDGRPRDFASLRDVLSRYLEDAGLREEAGGRLGAIPTGFVDLDRQLGGLQRSDMVVLAASTGLGKTSLALNIARNAAVEHKAHVALFSLEMSALELAYRFLGSESGVDIQRLRLSRLSERQREAVDDALDRLAQAPIWIDDTPALQEAEMRAKAKRLHNEARIDLVIVDYLQLMHTTRRIDNRVQEMTEVSHAVKALARELNAPVLALSQLSRAVQQRPDHRPVLSDLRESGSIEQDADVVMFIHRPDKHIDEATWEKLHPNEFYPKNIAQVMIAKHRNGPTGQVDLVFFERSTKFGNAAVDIPGGPR
ncbi:MAG: replicative DNA helicase [Chloroflexi bacterium]|nr:replicative DNA helicase [Chloroflexota bacterium]